MRDLAVCLVGQLRGVCEWSDLRSFFEVFLASFQNVDVFLTVTEEECARAHEFARLADEEELLRDADVNLIPVCLEEELKDAADVHWLEEFPKSPAGSKYYARSKLRSLLLPPKHMMMCGDVASKHAEVVGGYRWGARVRPDCLWHAFPSREEVSRLAPPMVLANFVPLPIQAVTEDQFLLAEWSQMQAIFSGFYEFLSNSTRSWGLDLAPPWCKMHATMRSDTFCQELFPENFLEMLLRRELGFQERKLRSICFDRIAPCNMPRTDYCNHLRPPRHAHGYYMSDPEHYELFGRDYFLTAPGIYAGYDSHLAVRFARFFRDEVRLLGQTRPPKVFDVGCGRGGYVEAFLQWGLIAVGVDGDSVVRRTLPAHGFLWDLTDTLSLPTSLSTARDDLCDFEPLLVKYPQYFVDLLPVQSGPLPGPLQELSLRHFCCNDLRCVGFTLQDGMGILWGLSAMAPSGKAVLRSGDIMFMRVDEAVAQLTGAYDKTRDSVRHLGVRFQYADWVLSLGVGQHIPSHAEDIFVGNLVRHAASGIVLSWGDDDIAGEQIVNRKPKAEVKRLLEAEGFKEDVAASEDFRLYAGLGYGGPRSDLLVFRRAMPLPTPPSKAVQPNLTVQALQELGYTGCELGQTFGLLPGASLEEAQMWIARGCRGWFLLEGEGVEATQLCISPSSDYQECYFPLKKKGPALAAALHTCEDVSQCFSYDFRDKHQYSSQDIKWHSSADHFVPVGQAWHGQPQLNMVYFKFARWLVDLRQKSASWTSPRPCTQIPGPSAGNRSFRLEWKWFWTSEWKHWLKACPGRSCDRFQKILQVLRSLGANKAAPKDCKRQHSSGWTFYWLSLRQKLRNALTAAKRWSDALRHRTDCKTVRQVQPHKAAAWRRLAILQSALARGLARVRPAVVLRSFVFVIEILPRLQTVLGSYSEASSAGRLCRQWPFQKPERSLPKNKAFSALSWQDSWEPSADDAHHLYRLAALDIDHV